MKTSKTLLVGLLTLGLYFSYTWAFTGIVYEATVDGVPTITICNPDDDTECLTMMDRNLGATAAGIGADADGYHYQRGNNYGFPAGTIASTTDKATWDDSYDNSGYYSETFIKSSSSPYDYWSDGARHDNLWGGSGDSASNNYGYPVTNPTDRRGPCPEGYHVPSQGEWNKTLQWWSSGYRAQGNTLTLNNPTSLSSFSDRVAQRAFQDDFKIPFAGIRFYSNASLNSQGSYAYLWSSSPYSTHAGSLFLNSSSVNTFINSNRADARSVRCFKDSYLSPSLSGAQAKFESNGATSVGNVMISDGQLIAPSITRYGYEILGWSIDSGSTVAEYPVGDTITDSDTTYYAITQKFPVCEETLDETETLTICNPSNTGECLTLMDRNLGATTAGIGADADGCLYQWGNNYCFPSVGSIESTGTLATWDARFNNSGYYSEIFIKGTSASKYDYWSYNTPSNHDSLWGGTTNGTTYPVTNPTDRRGPCPEGYHVPSYGERNKTLTRWTSSNNGSSDVRIKSRHFESNFLIPFAGNRSYSNASLSSQGSIAYLWSSSPYSTNARSLFLSSSYVNANSISNRADARSVRCFKDSYLSPSSATFLANGATSVGSATPTLSCTDHLSECNPGLLTGCTTTVVMPDITREGREILGWSTDSGATVAEYLVGETVTLSGDTTFYAITSKVYTATFQKNGATSIGANSASCTVYNTQTSCGLGIGHITICNPSDPTQCLTMMDRNLGAGSAGTGSCSYGNYYQRGNNYGFPSAGSVTTSADLVDCTPYGIGNNYSGSTFVVNGTSPYDRCQSKNDSLWGGSTSDSITYPVSNPTDRRGPCPEGYHVPSQGERVYALRWRAADYTGAGNTLTLSSPTSYSYFQNDAVASLAFRNFFLIPFAGSRYNSNASLSYQGSYAHLWSSSPISTIARNLNLSSSNVNANYSNFRASAYSVRCFKDSLLSPSLTSSGQASTSAPSITRAGWTVLGWDYSPDSTTATYQPCDEIELTGDTTLYAITSKPEIVYTATFSANGADSVSSGTVTCTIPAVYNAGTQGTTCTVTAPSITRSGWDILGWSISSGATTPEHQVGDSIPLSSDTTYYAITNRTLTATFDIGGDTHSTTGCDIYIPDASCTITTPDITMLGYSISGWSDGAVLYALGQSVTITGDTLYVLSYSPRIDTPYTVYHYLKDPGALTYSLYQTENLTGTTDTVIWLSGYVRDDIPCGTFTTGSLSGTTSGPGASAIRTKIAGDGSTTLYLYYSRRVYTVDLDKDLFTSMVEGAGTYECGQEVQIRAYPIDGYHFDMWEGNVDD